MSSQIVKILKVESVAPIPGADKIETIVVGGWQCVVPVGTYKVNDLVTFVPDDYILPEDLAVRLGVKPHLGSGNRTKVVKLRKTTSYGVVFGNEHGLPEGTDVAERYGITKSVPPVRNSHGGNVSCTRPAKNHPDFHKYTDIENARNYKLAMEGLEVVATIKYHGHNSRIGYIDGTLMCGSRNLPRVFPYKLAKPSLRGIVKNIIKYRLNYHRWLENVQVDDPTQIATDGFWFPYSLDGVKQLLATYKNRNIILYGECYGGGIQSFDYGSPQQMLYRAFDISIDGDYVDYDTFVRMCEEFKIPYVPQVYRGKFNFDKLVELARTRPPELCKHVNEGIVVKPIYEVRSPKLGRLILKIINDEYLLKKNEKPDAITDYTEE